jgi:aminoglycoside phosphotransferase family enzyme/predicted kinase
MTVPAKLLERSTCLVENLVRAGSFPHAINDIQVIETHISWVLLTGDFAYKIKKPVNLGFLDFSTLEGRRHFCDEELRLNRRFTDDLYLRVVEIGGSIESPVMDSTDGPALDVAVCMRQFPADALLSRQIAAQKVSVADMTRLGAELARMHADAPVAEPGSPYGSAQAVIAPVEDNFRTLESTCQSPSLARILTPIQDAILAESQRLKTIFEDRQRAGFIRECHGDLHLNNLVRWHDRIVPFDCLEFNADLRWVDQVNEVAFLFMDTLKAGRIDLASGFLNYYLAESGDYEGLALLPFYIAYRALVRAKVMALSANFDPDNDPEFRSYLDMAAHWVAPPEKSTLIITHGLSGSGKTAISEMLMTTLPAIRVRSDVERKRLHGMSAQAHSASGLDSGIYATAANEDTYRQLSHLAVGGLQNGFDVIVDASFLNAGERERYAQLAEDTGSHFCVLSCEAPEDVLRQRISDRERQGQDASEANLAVLEHQLESVQPLAAAENTHVVHIDTRTAWTGEKISALVRDLISKV